MQLFKNNAYSVLVAAITASATSLSVSTNTGARFPSPTNGDFFLATLIGRDANGAESAWEIVKVTARTGDSLAIERAQDGTTAVAWDVGTPLQLRVTAAGMNNKAALGEDVSFRTASTTGNASVGGDLTVTGNLAVNGTTTTVNSTTVTVEDPVITLGGAAAPTVDDSKDRGIEFNYHNGTTALKGFFGYDDSTGRLVFIPNATNTAEVFSGTPGTYEGNLWGNANSASILQTARTLALSGDASGSVSFDGSANATIAVTVSSASNADTVDGKHAADFDAAGSAVAMAIALG